MNNQRKVLKNLKNAEVTNEQIEEDIFAAVRRSSRVENEKPELGKPQRRSLSINYVDNPDNEVEHESIIQKMIKKRESVSKNFISDNQSVNKPTEEEDEKFEDGNLSSEEDREQNDEVEEEIFEKVRRVSQVENSLAACEDKTIRLSAHQED